MDVVTSDDHKLGTVVGEREGCAIVESGHVFKTRHAIPTGFLHESDGVLRATVGKEIVDDSPKVDGEDFDADAVKLHYGVIGITVVDPDPDERSAESERNAEFSLQEDPSLEQIGGFGADVATPFGHPRTTEAPDPRRDWVDDDRSR